MERLRDKVVLVTGASAGMGQAIAKRLAKAHKVRIIGCARRLDRLECIANEVNNLEQRFYPYKCDLSNPDEIKVGLQVKIRRTPP